MWLASSCGRSPVKLPVKLGKTQRALVPERDVALLKRFDIPICGIYPAAVGDPTSGGMSLWSGITVIGDAVLLESRPGHCLNGCFGETYLSSLSGRRFSITFGSTCKHREQPMNGLQPVSEVNTVNM